MSIPASGTAGGSRTRLPTPIGRQSDVVYLDATRDQVILGTAGSGKTLMAVHRAAHLVDPSCGNAGRTLLVTYNKSLVSYLNYLVGSHSSTLDIRNYHLVARGYLKSRGLFGGFNIVSDGGSRVHLIAEAIAEVAATRQPSSFFSRPIDFFEDELDWISGHGYSDRNSYLAAERIGRLAPLGSGQRRAVWDIREAYVRLRTAAGQRYDWWDLPTSIRQALAEDPTERLYRHIVIDEAQDLPPEAIRSLVEMVQPGGTVTLFADYAQQLYGQRTSYASCGLRIHKAELFKENYRNSVGIAQLAIETATLPHFTDSADLVTPTAPAVAGTPPTLFRAPTVAAELQAVRAQATELGKTGSVAILGRTWKLARHFAQSLKFRELREASHIWTGEPGIYIGTYYSAKGLEFDAVIMPYLDSKLVPDSSQIEAFGEPEAKEREARLLYVGITRARSELLVTYTDELTELLPAPASGFWLQTGIPLS